ncbi:MAG TPA: hypothetical protein VK498_14250 [Ferruginibacter sp.]|nr:hypothetical protein [Ferruginibacter sp.]
MKTDPLPASEIANSDEKQKERKSKRHKLGYFMLAILIIFLLICYFFLEYGQRFRDWNRWFKFILSLLLLASVFNIFDFKRILFDNEEYTRNSTVEAIVRKVRLRGVLFNNIAIILFLFTIVIIFWSFFILVKPSISETKDIQTYLAESLTIRIAASVLLIFLVQILFKVFKYLLRVAAFYNARADAIEFQLLNSDASLSKVELDKLMDMFTPEKYDISELEKASLFDSVIDGIKSKLGK